MTKLSKKNIGNCYCCAQEKNLRKDWRWSEAKQDMVEINVCERCSLLPNDEFLKKINKRLSVAA